MKTMNIIALTLVIIGGLNWGLVGLLEFNLVSALFGVDTLLTEIVYILVGAASLYALYLFKPVSETPRGHDSLYPAHSTAHGTTNTTHTTR
ncbi:MAG: DUF378 domain-containing protein [Alphaproteobacteria bacterium]